MYLFQPSFVYTANGASLDLLYCGLMPASGALVLWPFGRGFPVGQGEPLLLIAQGYLVGATK